MNTHKPSEKGQIVILLMLVMIVLLAFTALAIDGGMVFSDRRHAQSVADSASLAGAGAAAEYLRGVEADTDIRSICNSDISGVNGVATQAAINRADLNDVTIAWDNISTTHGVFVDCSSPDYLDVIVRISGYTDTAFAHLVFNNQLSYTVESVTRVYDAYSPGYGNTIVSLSPNCATNDGGITFDGNNYIILYDGGIHSNSCLIKNGTSGTIFVNPPSYLPSDTITYITTTNANMMDPAKVQPLPVRVSNPLDPWLWMQEINQDLRNKCDSMPSYGNQTGDTPNEGIPPGRYSRVRLNSANHQLVLQPGLYCISDELTVNGDTFFDIPMTIDGVEKKGVTIYLYPNANVAIAGSVKVDLSAPIDQSEVANNAMLGVLFFMDPNYAGEISINGTSDSIYTGGIYAARANVSVGGTSDVNGRYNIQVVAWDVKVHGGAGLEMNYDPDLLPRIESRLSVLK